MKVVLAITAEQSAKLQAAIAEQNADAVNWEHYSTHGDLKMFDHGFSFNTDQYIRVDGLRVEIHGQRCALATDGIFEILAKSLSAELDDLFNAAQGLPYDQISEARFLAWQLAKQEFAKVFVAEYETSDNRLNWWERLSDIAESLTIRDLKDLTGEQLGRNSLDGNKQLARIRELITKAVRGQCSDAAVHAELDKDEIIIFNRMKAHLRDAYSYSF